ncbi:TPA: hypothetical protein ACSP2D_004173, partial [Aeromonas veronii]
IYLINLSSLFLLARITGWRYVVAYRPAHEKTTPPAANRATGEKRSGHATIVEIAIRVKVNNS